MTRRRALALSLTAGLAASSLAVGPAAYSGTADPHGAPGIGDPYFPLDGNGGIDVASYDIHDRYRFGEGRLSGWTAIRLTATEWHLLEVLLRNPGKLLTRSQLLAEVWGPGYENADGNLRVYMAQLRRKLEPDPARPRHLLNEPGLGYRFEPGPREGQPLTGP